MPDAEVKVQVELPESVTKALAEVERLSAELAKLTKPVEPDGATLTTEIESAQKEHARVETELAKAREQLRKELEERTAELKASQAEVVKLNKQRRRERFIKLAHALPYLPGTQADDFGEMLDEINAALPDKRFSKLYQLFQSWNTVIEKNDVLMKEIGREGGELGMLSGAEAQIEALAREKTAADPKLTIEKARTLVIQEQPALYRKYQRELGGK